MKVHLLTGSGMAANCDCADYRSNGDELSSMASEVTCPTCKSSKKFKSRAALEAKWDRQFGPVDCAGAR